MKSILLITAVLLIAGFTQAQDAKAKKILDEVTEKTRTYTSVNADFIFSMENKEMEIDEKFEGSIQLKGQKYHLQMPKQGVEVFSDGTTLYNYMKEGNQVTISNIDDQSSGLMDPSAIFTIYEKGFKSEFVDEKKMGTKTVYHINLFPDTDEFDISKAEVYIDKASMMIQAANLYATDGNLYVIEVNKIETNQDFPDTNFVFNKANYTDVELIDLR
jgi:outer membrane lipoprotein-sorting protein